MNSVEVPLLQYHAPNPTLFFLEEKPDEGYDIRYQTFPISDKGLSAERCCRLLSKQLGISPLASYLFSCCEFPDPKTNFRRWLSPADPVIRSAHFRLCCHQFSPQQLAHLSETALHYYFISVKHSLLISKRLHFENLSPRDLHRLLQRLLNLDLCRILAKEALKNDPFEIVINDDQRRSITDQPVTDKVSKCDRFSKNGPCSKTDQSSKSTESLKNDRRERNRDHQSQKAILTGQSISEILLSMQDIVNSQVKLYKELFASVSQNFIEGITHRLLWWKSPKLIQSQHVPDLINEIRGKHWTDFAVVYLEEVEKFCPSLRKNLYNVIIDDRWVCTTVAPNGFWTLEKFVEFGSICNGQFSNDKIIISIIGQSDPILIRFQNDTDARSFAIELSAYHRILHFGSPLFANVIFPSQRFQQSQKCWGPLSENSDKHSIFQASLLKSGYSADAVAFESAEFYDRFGIFVNHGARQSVRWLDMEPNEFCFIDSKNGEKYQSLLAAASDQLMELLAEERPRLEQPGAVMLFEAHSALQPFQFITDRAINSSHLPKITRFYQLIIHGRYNTLEIARTSGQPAALKYVNTRWRMNNDVLDAFTRSQNYLIQLDNHLKNNKEASLFFRRLFFVIDQDTILYPKCMVLEYLQESMPEALTLDGLKFSLLHLLQVCMDLVEAIDFLHKIDFVHGEISCKRLFVRQKPASNGFGEFHAKLVEPSFNKKIEFSIGKNHVSIRSKNQDLFDLGTTINQIFLMATGIEMDHENSLIDIHHFDQKNRYPPHLSSDLLNVLTDHIQRILLSLMGNEKNRPNSTDLKSEFSALINGITVQKFIDPSWPTDFDSIVVHRRVWCCGPEDLEYVVKHLDRQKSVDSQSTDQPIDSGLASEPDIDQSNNADCSKAIIGGGRFGVVLKVKHIKTNRIFALKKLKPQFDQNNRLVQLDELRTELEILLNLRHPNIVQLFGIEQEKHGSITGIIMNFEANGALQIYLKNNRLRPPDENQKVKWALEIAVGMAYLHENGVVHRDLFSRNILLSDDLMAKITDFGLSVFGFDFPRPVVPQCWPPEWRRADEQQHIESRAMRYDPLGDVWCYGITLWEIDNNGDQPRNELKMNSSGSPTLQTMIKDCIKEIAFERPTFAQLVSKYF